MLYLVSPLVRLTYSGIVSYKNLVILHRRAARLAAGDAPEAQEHRFAADGDVSVLTIRTWDVTPHGRPGCDSDRNPYIRSYYVESRMQVSALFVLISCQYFVP